jgi:putative ABC transport system permease protein
MNSLGAMLGNTVLMALREIRRNAMRSILTMLGIVIGVAAVIALVTLSEGASQKVTNEITSMGVNMLTVTPGAQRRGPSNVSADPLTIDDARALAREIPLLSAVAPTASRSVLGVFANRSHNTQVTGTTNEYFSVRNTRVAGGRQFADVELSGGQPVCIIGQTVRRELFGADSPLGSSIRLGRVSCLVIGLTQAKGQSTFGMDQDDYILMPLFAFQRRIAGMADVNAISVSTIDESQTDRAKAQLKALMRERRRVSDGQVDDFSVHDTREIVETLQTVTTVLTALLGAVAAVSLIVGGIGIMNIMLVSVTERTREIGIRLAIGARAHEVLLQFLIEAVVLCVFGGIVGMALGLGGSYAVARAIDIPFKFLLQVVAIAFAFSGCVGVAFGIFPARKASRLNPIEALRHE